MSCLVRDLSVEGARIIFSEAVTIPDMINLHIPQKNQTLRALTWRRGDESGLGFSAANPVPDPLPDSNELMKRVAQLEGKIAALHRVLNRMKGERPDLDDEAAA
jgi:hypothetical protein